MKPMAKVNPTGLTLAEGLSGTLSCNPAQRAIKLARCWFKEYFTQSPSIIQKRCTEIAYTEPILVFLGKKRSHTIRGHGIYVHEHTWKDENDNDADKDSKTKTTVAIVKKKTMTMKRKQHRKKTPN